MFHSALPPHLRCSALKIVPIDPKPYLAYRRIAVTLGHVTFDYYDRIYDRS
jgi:hypothetical protein